MFLDTRIRRIPPVWRVTILGTIAALPATVILNWLPNSEASIGGGIILLGALIAGGIATNRPVEPSAAGLRAGLLGGMTAVFEFVLIVGTTVMWSPITIVPALIACIMFLCISPVFGLIFGRIGGWVGNTVADFGAN